MVGFIRLLAGGERQRATGSQADAIRRAVYAGDEAFRANYMSRPCHSGLTESKQVLPILPRDGALVFGSLPGSLCN
jgi:hypothetical protein